MDTSTARREGDRTAARFDSPTEADASRRAHGAPRLRLAAAAACAAVVARLVSVLTWPPDSDAGHARMLATASAHPSAWLTATYSEVLCWLLAGFSVLTVAGVVRGRRGAGLAAASAWVYGSSLITLGLLGSQNVVTYVLAQQPDRAAMVTVVDELHSSSAMAPFVAVVLLGELFLVVLCVGLARTRIVGWWYVGLGMAAVAGYVVTADSSTHLVVLAGFFPLGLSWLVLARLLAGAAASVTSPR
jgi:hypothetical protein